MISSNELSEVFKIISDENKTFRDIAQIYNELFKDKDKLRIALSLCILLKDNLLNITQRLISFYLLYLMKINFHIDVGPFLPLIIETIQTTKNISEQNFLFDFLNNEINYINSTVKNFLKDKTKVNYNKTNVFFLQSLYQKYLLEKPKDKKMSNFIRHILYDRKKTDIKHIDNHTSDNLPQFINTKEEMSFKLCEPSYISFCPKLKNNEFIDKEPIWIMPQLKHNFNWNH
jgi:hypothetical protein